MKTLPPTTTPLISFQSLTSILFQKIYSDFELQGVMEDKLNSKAYQTVAQRMQAEEATCQLTMTSEDGEDEFGDGDDDDGAASVAASKSSKIPVLDKLGDDAGNISVSSVSNLAKAKVGNLIGKGMGLGTTFGKFF
jgi:calcium-dependent secretion activator